MQARFAVLLLLAAAAGAAAQPANPPTVKAAIDRRRDLSTYAEKLALYPDVLKQMSGDFYGTVFAPSNAAFEKAAAEGIDVTTDILLYHVIPGPPAPVTSLNDDQIFVTKQGETIQAQYADGKLTLVGKANSSAHITAADIMVGPASYIVVHVVDSILLPYPLGPTKATPLVPATPDEPATPAEPTGTVGAKDMTPPKDVSPSPDAESPSPSPEASPEEASPSPSPEEASPSPEEYSPVPEEASPKLAEPPAGGPLEVESIAEAAAAANLTTLLAALEDSELTDELGAGFVGTVFAPTDAAFDAFAAKYGPFSAISPDDLRTLVNYHVIVGDALTAEQLSDGQVLRTLNGQDLTVSIGSDGVYILSASGGRAMVVTADVKAGDSIVHIIDAVLEPAVDPEPAASPSLAPAPEPLPTSGAAHSLASAAALVAAAVAALLLA
ncbi:beta-Ig-H3 fasciclin isoform B [Micractinium conductrix]|uniref:Beta-Ig-H3 fasciclin isoform A n=1 Tax=Micractinium conductrix TaxID=554055 RepID=A0A2P6V4L1_9CHLO|nr:beta-Ig-H3 fasciclin isoform A [Micractinium conductrix]PSC69019.1 beta-Ig-H3 fasciclin isoform B [Micractinium conductrix]|eukprot:PSC69018.1 beta-Ig-H3 fasciclin isoform A [Micractinium conductrix]